MLLGGAMLLEFTVVSTAFEVDVVSTFHIGLCCLLCPSIVLLTRLMAH